MELVLAGIVGRRTVNLSGLTAITAGIVVLWLAEFAGCVVAGLHVGGSAYLALATATVAAVCVGIGAVASELAPTRRMHFGLGGTIVGLLFLLRVLADTVSGLGWLRWATPLGWAEQLRPFTGARPLVFLLPITTAVLSRPQRGPPPTATSAPACSRRATAPTQTWRLLTSPDRAGAARPARDPHSVDHHRRRVRIHPRHRLKEHLAADITKSVQKEIAKLGTGSITTPPATSRSSSSSSSSRSACSSAPKSAPRQEEAGATTRNAARTAAQPPALVCRTTRTSDRRHRGDLAHRRRAEAPRSPTGSSPSRSYGNSSARCSARRNGSST